MSRGFSEDVAWVADEVARQVAGGMKRLEVTLPLPAGPGLLLAVHVREQFSRRRWELALLGQDRCRLCQRHVGALRSEGTSPAELVRLLHRAADAVTSCDCAAAPGQAGGARRSEPTPAPPGRRINVLPQGPAVSADAAPPAAPGVIRIKPASKAPSPSRGLDDVGEVRAGAPSFIYDLASGVVVGVTLTEQVCHLLARHCDESNRHGREVGGVIAGYSFEAEAVGGRKSVQTIATDIIPVESNDSSGAHLCLGEQDWLHVQRQFDEKYSAQGKVRVGWYHTHPTQTVFFSNMDADAHTVFRQPHQFALVVDPRKMEAGLFYWKDYEKLLHAGPLRFMLKARAEGASAGALPLTPSGALPGSHPPPRPGPRESLASYTAAALGRLGGRALIALAVVPLALGTALYLLNRQSAPPGRVARNTTSAPQRAAGEPPSLPGNDAQPAQPTHVLLVSDSVVNGKATRTVASAGPRASKVTYVAAPPQNGGARWDAPGESESRFFETVFGLRIQRQQGTAEQKALQSALGMNGADGLWGQETRAAFLSQAVELRGSGGLLVFKLGHVDARVRFLDGNAGAATGRR